MKTNSTNRILFVVAHPFLRESRSNRAVVEAVAQLPEVSVHALYDRYPYFHIDVPSEKKALEAHDIIVFQHPFYWYSAPALLRHWQSEVLQAGWAYGEGSRLKGKDFLVSITVGGPQSSYASHGYNRFPMETYLAPCNQMAYLCGMQWHDPIVLYDSIDASPERLREHGELVRKRLARLLEQRRER